MDRYIKLYILCVIVLYTVTIQPCCATSPDVLHTEATGAFQAVLYNHALNLAYHQYLVFDQVLLNVGNHYSSSDGTYTCAVTGTYVFHVTIMNYNAQSDTFQWHLQLVMGGNPVMNVTAWNPTYIYGDHWVGNNLCVLHCIAGERVALQVSYPQTGGVNIFGTLHTGFSGFLLHDDASTTSHDLGAFYVTLHDPVYGLPHNNTLTYENVQFDDWNVYNDITGEYTCAVSGTYFFHVAISSLELNNGPLEMVLAVNGATVMRVTARNPQGGHRLATNACVVHCQEGDRVTVRADNTDEGFVAVWGENFSSLAGFMIHEDAAAKHTSSTGVFYAVLQQNLHLNWRERMIFDTAYYNPGGHYNVTSGIYRCPTNGTYVFHSTATTTETVSMVTLDVYINGTRRSPWLCPRNGQSQSFSGSAMWVTACSANEEVWLQIAYDGLGTGVTLKGDAFTTFSGFVLSTN